MYHFSTYELIASVIASLIVGIQIGVTACGIYYRWKMLNSGAAYWAIDTDGHKELKIINGRELEMVMIQVADKSRDADSVFTIVQHPESKKQIAFYFRDQLDLLQK
jgi:hypothetical protein